MPQSPLVHLRVPLERLLTLADRLESVAAHDSTDADWLHEIADRARKAWVAGRRRQRDQRGHAQQDRDLTRQIVARRETAERKDPRAARLRVYCWKGDVLQVDGTPARALFCAAHSSKRALLEEVGEKPQGPIVLAEDLPDLKLQFEMLVALDLIGDVWIAIEHPPRGESRAWYSRPLDVGGRFVVPVKGSP